MRWADTVSDNQCLRMMIKVLFLCIPYLIKRKSVTWWILMSLQDTKACVNTCKLHANASNRIK